MATASGGTNQSERNEMTDQDKIKALAELAGIQPWKPILPFEEKPKQKPYLTSYDAIIPLIQKQDMLIKESMCKLLGVKHDYCAWIRATPTQLADALLVATGKMKGTK